MIIDELREELKTKRNHLYGENVKRFFKEDITHYGVRTPEVRKISQGYFRRIKAEPKEKIFTLCEMLLQSGFEEEKTIAFDWTFRLRAHYVPEDFVLFERWLDNYVTSWASCDAYCTNAFGEFILQYGQFVPRVKSWTTSINRWMRRASAVIMIYPNRRGKYIDDSFDIANHLLKDEDDLVQKGYGWMLKEMSNYRIRDVYDFVMKKRSAMPRTALRYAVEKMPQVLREKAMAK